MLNNKNMNTEITLKKINTSKIIYVSPEDSILKVEEIFDTLSIHHILVLEGDTLKGIISKTDLLKMYKENVAKGILPDRSAVRAGEIMTSDLITLDVDDTIGLAADIFLSNKVHSIPLYDGDKLAGIITNHDIIKYCFKI
jgi:acetoin utilization protein AcuB